MRLYNGCPDKELQAVMDRDATAHKRAKAAGLGLTYFPAEGQWMAFKDHISVSGFHDSPTAALEGASL